MLSCDPVILLHKLIADFEIIGIGEVSKIPTGRGPSRAGCIRPPLVGWNSEVTVRGGKRKPSPSRFSVAEGSLWEGECVPAGRRGVCRVCGYGIHF
jgi:hypothetical protein